MITIVIDEETETKDEIAQVLLVIANQIERGTVRGYDPDWHLEGEENNDTHTN